VTLVENEPNKQTLKMVFGLLVAEKTAQGAPSSLSQEQETPGFAFLGWSLC